MDKLAYVKQMHLTDDLIKKAKRNYESDIMRSIKSHPQSFYSYIRNKQKVKVTMTNLEKEDGNFTKKDSESCQVLSGFLVRFLLRKFQVNYQTFNLKKITY